MFSVVSFFHVRIFCILFVQHRRPRVCTKLRGLPLRCELRAVATDFQTQQHRRRRETVQTNGSASGEPRSGNIAGQGLLPCLYVGTNDEVCVYCARMPVTPLVKVCAGSKNNRGPTHLCRPARLAVSWCTPPRQKILDVRP